MFSEEMLENANYMYAAIFAAGAFLAYYWMKPDDKEEELFKFKTMNPTVVNNQEWDLIFNLLASIIVIDMIF